MLTNIVAVMLTLSVAEHRSSVASVTNIIRSVDPSSAPPVGAENLSLQR